jgi:glucose 1-dehydrogenase
MDLTLKDKVVLVADNSCESASAVINTLKREGALVAACLGEGQAKPACADEYYRCDLADMDKAEELKQALATRFDRLDAVIFRQEEVQATSLLTQDADGFADRLRVSRAAFVCCKVLGEYMGASGGGAMLFVTTLHDEKPNGSEFVHSVTQGMLENLVMEAALEYGAAGVRVNQIAVGAMEGMPEKFESDISTFYQGAQYKAPLCRLGTAGDVAELAAFLISGRAAFVNGARVRMDGGMMLEYLDPKANNRAQAARKEAR